MGIIYCLTFSSGKKYIGMTSDTISRRMAVHRMCLKTKQWLVYRAWRKYGDPEVSILAAVEVDKLREAEREAIAVHNTMSPNGYNLVSGGEGALTVAEETRLKMSLAHKGRIPTEKMLAALAARNVGNTYALGRKQTAEHAEKRAAANRGKKRTAEFGAAISARRKGIKMSDETKAKIAESIREIRKTRAWSTRKKVD